MTSTSLAYSYTTLPSPPYSQPGIFAMAYPLVHTMANDTYNQAKFQDGQLYMVRRRTGGLAAHNGIPQILPYGSTM